MTSPEFFYTPQEVASIFRLTRTALGSQRKRGIEPGSLAVKVGGKYLYPKNLIDHYLEHLAKSAQTSHGLDESFAADLFRSPPTNTRVLTLAEAAEKLGIASDILSDQWGKKVYPGALGWQKTPGTEIVFAPRDLDIWTEANANQDRQDTSSTISD